MKKLMKMTLPQKAGDFGNVNVWFLQSISTVQQTSAKMKLK